MLAGLDSSSRLSQHSPATIKRLPRLPQMSRSFSLGSTSSSCAMKSIFLLLRTPLVRVDRARVNQGAQSCFEKSLEDSWNLPLRNKTKGQPTSIKYMCISTLPDTGGFKEPWRPPFITTSGAVTIPQPIATVRLRVTASFSRCSAPVRDQHFTSTVRSVG